MTEKRRYIRISSVLPVEFFIIDGDGKRITPWLQGFTHDIGKGGICIYINDLWQGFWERFNYRGAQLVLKIDLPLGKTISATAKIAWINQKAQKDFNQYIAGIEFIDITKKDSQFLFRYALVKKTIPVFAAGVIAILLLTSLLFFGRVRSLVRENRALVKGYVSVLERETTLEEILKREKEKGIFFKQRQEELQNKMASLKEEISRWRKNYQALQQTKEGEYLKEAESLKEKIALLEGELAQLQRENEFLKAKENERMKTSLQLEKEFGDLEEEKRQFSYKIIEGLYNWIKNRQDLVSGLVLSYEGDRSLEEICFTYDQALATIVFVLFDKRERAQKVLDFYLKNVREGKSIYNAYYTKGDVSEYVIHSGPNAWIGLAALNYIKLTGDKKYFLIVKRVANFLLGMIDKEGGIKGGPKERWYSTEHNLDAFAFFNLLSQMKPDKKYLEAKEKIKEWISRYAYTSYGPPVKRGKGDATIATDTYAWSVTTFGPALLSSLKMDPKAILEFAIENCEVKAKFKYKDRDIKVTGFDFAKFRNTARGGVVSSEWTAQMILSFEVMADYYKDKDKDKYKQYLNKANFYFNELQKMLITSPSKVGREDPCLPYASSASVDTGHGWRTPKGNRTGSLASTAYFLITYYGYNPLQGKFLSISLKDAYEKRTD
jgi:hypothetical protein